MGVLSGWAVLTGILIVAELVSGSFYLLMMALGAAAGCAAAWLHISFEIQVVSASIVGTASVMLLKYMRSYGWAKSNIHNPHNDLDIGNTLDVSAWNPDDTARVHYRGAPWTAYAVYANPQMGKHVIVGIDGTRLQLKKRS